ncbi:MAG: ergothioneine biosynthesis glutamate--cysteine ligase EgtA [Acidimicrobiales bacterium]
MPSPRRSLTLEDVQGFVRERCFPPSDSAQVGVELEWLTIPRGRPDERVDQSVVEAAVRGVPGIREGLRLPAGTRVTFEPGGQLELSSEPYETVGDVCRATSRDLAAVRVALAEVGVELVGAGLDDRRSPRRLSPSPRYVAMERYFDRAWPSGRTMMCSTAAVQVNLDVTGPEGIARRWPLAHAVGPVLAAAFANSPMRDGRPSGWRSSRLAVWADLDRSRSAPALRGRGTDPVGDWVSYALAARVMLVRTGAERFSPLPGGMSFGSWMEGGTEMGFPDVEDLAYHLTTLFPPVRPRGWLELRMVDALPEPWWRVALAVTAVLLQDDAAADSADRACAPAAGRWLAAARYGLSDPVLGAAASSCFAAALEALDRRGADPGTVAATAAYHDRYVAVGRCPADDRLASWIQDGSPGRERRERIATLEPQWS